MLQPLPSRVVERFAHGHHVVAVDFDAVLCGVTADDTGAQTASPVVDALRALTALSRATLVVVSDRTGEDLVDRCAQLSPTWIVAEGGRELIESRRRINTRSADVAERLHAIVAFVSAESAIYVGPLAYAIGGRGITAVPIAAGAPLYERALVIGAVARALIR